MERARAANPSRVLLPTLGHGESEALVRLQLKSLVPSRRDVTQTERIADIAVDHPNRHTDFPSRHLNAISLKTF